MSGASFQQLFLTGSMHSGVIHYDAHSPYRFGSRCIVEYTIIFAWSRSRDFPHGSLSSSFYLFRCLASSLMATTSGGLDVAVPGVDMAGRPLPGEAGGQLFRDYPPFARGDDGHTQICEWATRVESSLWCLANSIMFRVLSARFEAF